MAAKGSTGSPIRTIRKLSISMRSPKRSRASKLMLHERVAGIQLGIFAVAFKNGGRIGHFDKVMSEGPCLLTALFGQSTMSDLSPECDQKRTSTIRDKNLISADLNDVPASCDECTSSK